MQFRSSVSALARGMSFFLCAVLAGCGSGGSDGGSPSANTAAPTGSQGAPATPMEPTLPVTPPVSGTSSARVAGVEFGQSFLFPSGDSAAVLVADKAVLVKVNVTAGSALEKKPAGSLQVQSGTGALLQTIALTPPTAALPTTVPAVPSFADSYTALVPANLVKPDMRLAVILANGQPGTTLAPRVGGGVAMKIVAVPVQIAGITGQVVAGVGNYTQARLPMASVTVVSRTPYVSTKGSALPTTEAEWDTAFRQILGELNNLRTLEGASSQTHYFGFLPKRSFGLAGMGYQPGRAAVGFDMPGNAATVLDTLTHELGHNLSLQHAPCGGPADPDPAYPYTNALLGAPGRYIWGYNLFTQAFTDPRRTDIHDAMSYCNGNTFSDYNYRLMQVYATPADQRIQLASVSAVSAPQELLLMSGTVEGDRVELGPVKVFTGRAELTNAGPYTLRIVGAQGVVNYQFSTIELDHAPAQKHFSFSVVNPGAITAISILKDGVTLMQKSAAQFAPQPVKQTAASARVLSANSAAVPPIQFNEQDGVLRVSWNQVQYPYLTITHVGGQRTGLAQDLQGGSATIQVTGLPSGGSFEFGLSDGLNSVRVLISR